MINSNYQLLIFLAAILVGFVFLIFFLLKLRDSQFKKNRLLTGQDVWSTFESEFKNVSFEKNNLIYAIIQDNSFTEVLLLFRNFKDEELGTIIYQSGKRKRSLRIGEKNFVIEYPLRMNKTAILREEKSGQILATYVKTSWLGKHEFDIPGYGKILSNQIFFNTKAACNYIHNGTIVGWVQNIVNIRVLGRAGILPENLPLEVRMFMLFA